MRKMNKNMDSSMKKVVATDIDFEMGVIDIAAIIKELFVGYPELNKVLLDFKNGQILMVED